MPFKRFVHSAFLAAVMGASALQGATPSRPYDSEVPAAAVQMRKDFWHLYNEHRAKEFGKVWIDPFEELDNLATSAYLQKNGFTRFDQVSRQIKLIDQRRKDLLDTPLGREMRKHIVEYVRSQLLIINKSTGSNFIYSPSE